MQTLKPRLRLKYSDDHIHTAEELVGTRRVPVSLRKFRDLEKRGEGPRRIPLTSRTYGYLERDIKRWLDERARREAVMSSEAASEDAAEIAPQVAAALRCWMNGDRAGWARVINESKFPTRTFTSVLFNVVAKFAAEADDPEQFLTIVGELIVRD